MSALRAGGCRQAVRPETAVSGGGVGTPIQAFDLADLMQSKNDVAQLLVLETRLGLNFGKSHSLAFFLNYIKYMSG
jgi:hypothetical protein